MARIQSELEKYTSTTLKNLKLKYKEDFKQAPDLEPLLYSLIRKNFVYCNPKIIAQRKKREVVLSSILTQLNSAHNKLNKIEKLDGVEDFYESHINGMKNSITATEMEIYNKAKFLIQIANVPVPGDSITTRKRKTGKKGSPYYQAVLDVREYNASEKRTIGMLFFLIAKYLKKRGFKKIDDHIHAYLSEMSFKARGKRDVFPQLKNTKRINTYINDQLPFKEIKIPPHRKDSKKYIQIIVRAKMRTKKPIGLVVDHEIYQVRAMYDLILNAGVNYVTK